VNSINQLRNAIDDDIYPIEVPYNYPPSNHIACAFRRRIIVGNLQLSSF
jgi:hypothetical protein